MIALLLVFNFISEPAYCFGGTLSSAAATKKPSLAYTLFQNQALSSLSGFFKSNRKPSIAVPRWLKRSIEVVPPMHGKGISSDGSIYIMPGTQEVMVLWNEGAVDAISHPVHPGQDLDPVAYVPHFPDSVLTISVNFQTEDEIRERILKAVQLGDKEPKAIFVVSGGDLDVAIPRKFQSYSQKFPFLLEWVPEIKRFLRSPRNQWISRWIEKRYPFEKKNIAILRAIAKNLVKPFHLDSLDVLQMIQTMREKGEIPPTIETWASENPVRGNIQNSLNRMKTKKSLGATTILTQFSPNVGRLERWLRKAVRQGLTEDLNILIGVPIIPSSKSLRTWPWFAGYNMLTNGTLPLRFVFWWRTLKTKDFATTGQQFAADYVQRLRSFPGVSGIHIMPLYSFKALRPFYKADIHRILQPAGIRPFACVGRRIMRSAA